MDIKKLIGMMSNVETSPRKVEVEPEPVQSEEVVDEEVEAEGVGGVEGGEGEVKEEVVEPDPLDQLRDTIAKQAAELEELKQRVAAPPQQDPSTSPPAAESIFDVEELKTAFYENDFDTVVGVFQKLLTHVQEQQEVIRERVLKDLPEVATNITRQQFSLMKAVDAFYGENEDLVPHAQMVGAAANRIVAENPNLQLSELFDQAGQEVRKQLGLKRKAVTRQESASPPAFPKVKGARKEMPELDPVKADLAKMSKVVIRR